MDRLSAFCAVMIALTLYNIYLILQQENSIKNFKNINAL